MQQGRQRTKFQGGCESTHPRSKCSKGAKELNSKEGARAPTPGLNAVRAPKSRIQRRGPEHPPQALMLQGSHKRKFEKGFLGIYCRLKCSKGPGRQNLEVVARVPTPGENTARPCKKSLPHDDHPMSSSSEAWIPKGHLRAKVPKMKQQRRQQNKQSTPPVG